MDPDSHQQRIEALLKHQPLLRSSDLHAIGVPRVVLTRMTAAGQLERIGRGLYRRPDAAVSEHESLLTVARRAPQAVFCLLTALQFHELTTQLPREVWIAMPRGSHVPRLDWPPLRLIQMSHATHAAGIETVERDGVSLRVYAVAKTVADCFKYRNRIGLDVAIEALREARAKRKATAADLWQYATVCRVANVMRPYLEAIE